LSAKHKDFSNWFNSATAGLRRTTRQRLEMELRAHYDESVEAARSTGATEEQAHERALENLGDALETRELYKEEYAEAAPWEGDFLPEKLADAEYGYVKGNQLVPCTREDLIKICKGTGMSPSEVTLVWTPEHSRVTPVESIPFLFESIKENRQKSARFEIFSSAMWGAALLAQYWHGEFQNFRHVALFLALGAVAPGITGFRNLIRARALTPEILAEEVAETPAFWLWSGRQKSWVCLSLMAVFGVVWILQIVAAGFGVMEAAVLDKVATLRGEWWRLLTAIFLHGGMMHLLFNILALGIFGHLVEVGLGRRFVAPVFLGSALAGSILSLALNPMASIGASGGIMGLATFLYAAVGSFSDLPVAMVRRWVATALCFTAVAGIIVYDVFDSAAHLGGVLAGFAIGASVKDWRKARDSKALLCMHWLACAILAAGATGAAVIMMKGR
jgi:membrane associated rhomboid family serine protease